MVARFEFATTGRVVFGAGASRELGELAAAFGRRALVVTGRSADRTRPLADALRSRGLAVEPFAVLGEPDIARIEQGRTLAHESGADFVIGIGGGSAIDAAKALAALAANNGEVLDYLEVVGRGRPLEKPSLPCLAVPTTAGTGSEATRNAVIGAPERRVKVSLRHISLLPRLAIVDPELTLSLPPALTASTGLDALTQLIEPYLSRRANPMTDALCAAGIRLAAEALPTAVGNGECLDARAHMSLASLWSGIALANAGLGAVHGFAGPIGGRAGAPHGAICAALLPHAMAVNLRAIDARAPDSPARARFDEVARLVTGRPAATAADGVAWLYDIVRRLEIPPLSHYGIGSEAVEDLVADAARASSMAANPIALTGDELRELLTGAMNG